MSSADNPISVSISAPVILGSENAQGTLNPSIILDNYTIDRLFPESGIPYYVERDQTMTMKSISGVAFTPGSMANFVNQMVTTLTTVRGHNNQFSGPIYIRQYAHMSSTSPTNINVVQNLLNYGDAQSQTIGAWIMNLFAAALYSNVNTALVQVPNDMIPINNLVTHVDTNIVGSNFQSALYATFESQAFANELLKAFVKAGAVSGEVISAGASSYGTITPAVPFKPIALSFQYEFTYNYTFNNVARALTIILPVRIWMKPSSILTDMVPSSATSLVSGINFTRVGTQPYYTTVLFSNSISDAPPGTTDAILLRLPLSPETSGQNTYVYFDNLPRIECTYIRVIVECTDSAMRNPKVITVYDSTYNNNVVQTLADLNQKVMELQLPPWLFARVFVIQVCNQMIPLAESMATVLMNRTQCYFSS